MSLLRIYDLPSLFPGERVDIEDFDQQEASGQPQQSSEGRTNLLAITTSLLPGETGRPTGRNVP